MTKSVLIVFLILSLASIFMYIGLYLQSVNSYNDFNALKSIRSFFVQNETYSRCSPFKLNFKPYRVKIDNNTYPRSLPLHLNDSIDFNCLNQSSDIKKILFWNPFFGQSSYGYEVGKIYPFVNKNCPVTSCELTVDKNRVNESDLVLVHLRDSYSQFPSYRPNDQRWVFVLYESPVHSGDFTNLNGFFNMTSSYHLDSDFPDFYSTFSALIWKRNYSFDENKDYLKNKTDFAAAIISNCGGSSGRLNYIRELQNYITVNVYGKCGKACPAQASFNKNITNCKEIISYQYKFYFAFENSVCKDYVTEKFFEILRYPIIPVVLGGGKYEHFIPKSGFINVNDFKTPKDLANYLLYLEKNSTAYNSFFEWKKYVQFQKNFIYFSVICDMCIQLQLDSYIKIKPKILSNFWNRKGDCH